MHQDVDTSLAGSPCSACPMDERLYLTERLCLDDELNVRKIKASCGDVGGHDSGNLACFEVKVYPFSVHLLHITMQHPAVLPQIFPELFDLSFGLAEDDGPSVL